MPPTKSTTPTEENREYLYVLDALDRWQSFNYEEVNTWKGIRSKLNDIFKGEPGEMKVIKGNYVLSRYGKPDCYYGEDKWRYVHAGEEFIMRLIVLGVASEPDQCPRCRAKQRDEDVGEDGLTKCWNCPIRHNVTYEDVAQSRNDQMSMKDTTPSSGKVLDIRDCDKENSEGDHLIEDYRLVERIAKRCQLCPARYIGYVSLDRHMQVAHCESLILIGD